MSTKTLTSGRKYTLGNYNKSGSAAYTTTGLQQYFDAYLSSLAGTISSSSWTDQMGYGNLTFTGSPTVTTGILKKDNYVTFNGTSQYGAGLVTTNLSTFTFYCWIKSTSFSDNASYYIKPAITGYTSSGTASRDFGITIGGGQAGIWSGLASSGDQINQPTQYDNIVSDGKWHEIAVTSDTTGGTKFYFDQKQIGSTFTVGKATDATNNWRLGMAWGQGNYYANFDCAVCMFYTTELTTAQLAANYGCFSPRYK